MSNSKQPIQALESRIDSVVAGIKNTAIAHYGCVIEVNDAQLGIANREALTAEVVLIYNGNERRCGFEELAAFMKGNVQWHSQYEDDLPDDMTDKEYDDWYAESAVIDGVRMGKPFVRGAAL